jgi:hypothetical protein
MNSAWLMISYPPYILGAAGSNPEGMPPMFSVVALVCTVDCAEVLVAIELLVVALVCEMPVLPVVLTSPQEQSKSAAEEMIAISFFVLLKVFIKFSLNKKYFHYIKTQKIALFCIFSKRSQFIYNLKVHPL